MIRITPIFLLLALAGCDGPVAPDHEVRDAVRLQGLYYVLTRDEPLQPQDAGQVLGPEHARVLRQVAGCDGVVLLDPGIGDPCGLRDGDSNRLPAQTPLHAPPGVPAGQQVATAYGGRFLVFTAYFPPD
jgi:hypothetical protein